MAKVYVIVKVDVFDGEEEVTIIGTYTDKDDAQKKAEPTIQISVNLFDDHTVLEEICHQVPLSQAAFYIPNLKDTLVYHDSNFIVREVKRDFNKNKVIITAYKA